MTSRVRKIAVLRANAIGDFMFSLPALESLRAVYPEAEIVLLGADWHHDFLEGRPSPVDRTIVAPVFPGVRDWPEEEYDPAGLDRFFEDMARENWDIAVQLHGGGRHSNRFVSRMGAHLTVGLKTPDAIPLDRWVPYVYFQPEILRCLEVVGLLGVRPVTLEPRLTVTERDLAESCQVVPDPGQPIAALHPGAGDGRRRWPLEKFAAVGDALAAAGMHIVVTGTLREEHLVRGVLEAMYAPAQALCDDLSLGGLAGMLARCSLVVSNDSGPLHLAAAVGTPTVGIYWCGNLINADPMTRALHRPLVSWRLACPVCGRDCIYDNCEHHESFVADIPVEQALQTARDVLAYASAQETVRIREMAR